MKPSKELDVKQEAEEEETISAGQHCSFSHTSS